MDIKKIYTDDVQKAIKQGMELSSSSSGSSDSDSTSTTEELDIECDRPRRSHEIDPFQANYASQDRSVCSNCGNKLISYEDAERITRSEAATYVEIHAAKIIELETIKFNAKQRKLNGDKVLRGPKKSVSKKGQSK